MKAVLWDLDGTLADSSEFHWRSWRDTMASAGEPITHEQFLASFGQRNDAILGRWLGDRAAADRRRDIGDAKEALYRRMIQDAGIKPLPGAAEWVARLHAEGWRQAIASSAPRANVEVMANVLGLRAAMGALVSAEDVTHGKPAPDVFLAAAARLGVPADRCVVVEDAEAGIEAARRAGMRRIGVGRADFSGADISVVSLSDLAPDAFDRLVA
ncbi:MAG TPA: HAD family phosphatase [Vicinamibacterales bacterium]|nr:HAD family phosphatase [Vicinamibacterales bacterium]